VSAGRLAVARLGVVPYAEALARQRALAEDRIAGRIPDTLLLLEHPSVITLGRGTKATSLPLDADALRRRGIEVYEIERGGDVTYHGPGQLVGYPIFDLGAHRKDLHWFLRQIEEALIVALARFGITGERRASYTGVWTGGRKIASIGIHVRQWVTWHGFALNVSTDLSPFDLIVPCGIPDAVMTSVARELAGTGATTYGRTDARAHGGTALDGEVRDAVVESFVQTFGFDGVEALGAATAV
jgi:lipoyl(octanoyl) transferase